MGYTYDPTGNRTAVTDTATGTTSYAVNNLNQYTSVGAASYAYDGDGNLTSGNGIYLYDAQNRLMSASVGGNVDSFFYDSKNRVVQRTVNGVNTYLIYDGWDLIEERDASGNLSATYVHGVRQDELLSKTDSVNGTIYYHHNALGSVVNLTNASGLIVEKYNYDVFGKPSITDGSGNPLTASAYGNRFLFTGREWLAEVNLYDYRNRVYSADLGRFLQTDPIKFDAGDINIYRYCGNNSLNKKDSDGLCSDDNSENQNEDNTNSSNKSDDLRDDINDIIDELTNIYNSIKGAGHQKINDSTSVDININSDAIDEVNAPKDRDPVKNNVSISITIKF